jgi:GTPase SAR1 family protein
MKRVRKLFIKDMRSIAKQIKKSPTYLKWIEWKIALAAACGKHVFWGYML